MTAVIPGPVAYNANHEPAQQPDLIAGHRPNLTDGTGLACTVWWVDAGDDPAGVRLAELVAALSLATDLGLGQPQEHVLRQTVIARRLAVAAGLPDEQQTAVFYVSLLAWVGCVSDSHELATWFGDDQQLRADSYEVDKAGTAMLRFVLGHVGEGSGCRPPTESGCALTRI
jgi:hypothetical protein